MRRLLSIALAFWLTTSPVWAAVTASLLTSSQDNTNGTSFSTASITPGSNKLILACIRSRRAGAIAAPGISGNGLTWASVATVSFGTIASVTQHIHVFRAMGASPSTGAISLDYSAIGSQTSASWSIVEFDGVDTGGTNGSAAVVQSATTRGDSSTGLTPSLAAFGSASNATFGCFAGVANNAITEEGGWTELSDAGFDDAGVDIYRLQSQFLATNDTSPNATFSSMHAGAVSVEIKAAASAAACENSRLSFLGVSAC